LLAYLGKQIIIEYNSILGEKENNLVLDFFWGGMIAERFYGLWAMNSGY